MGVWSDKDTLPFTGFKTRLANFMKLNIPSSPVAAAWPADSPKQMGEAWDAIRGMLHGHPDMRDWQDPEHVVVWDEEVMWNEEVGLLKVYESVAREWGKIVDAGFIKEGSLKVFVETCVGVSEEQGIKRKGDDMEGKDEGIEKAEEKMDKGKGKAMDVDGEEMGNEVKRKAGMEGTEEKVSEGDKDEDGHRGKRRKVVLKE
jgi:hypothetical protein